MTWHSVLRIAIGLAVVFASLLLFVGTGRAQTQPATIRMWDACDPGTFNAAVGPGTCIVGQHGRTKHEFFINELREDHIAGAWRFNPLLTASDGNFSLATLNLNAGQQTLLQNLGGEVHTFTRVATFGGGFVPPLNGLSQNPVPAPECLKPANATNIFVEAGTTENGPTAGTTELPVGASKWECCIHPWMRMVVVVH